MMARTWCCLRFLNVAVAARVAPALLGFLLLLPPLVQAGERWTMQLYYDKLDSSLDIRDIQCPTAQRCIAAGVIVDKNGHARGTAILTSDGGKQWSFVAVNERPISLFFLNDSVGWMVTERGIWWTNESGRSWKKLEGPKKGILRVYFLDPKHGYAIGFPKAVFETIDGGRKWTKLAVADHPETNAEDTAYECISFLGQHGIIIGNVAEQHGERAPIWMNPERARFRREQQSTVAILETLDGGKTWQSHTATVLGNLSQVRLAKEGFAVTLFEYRDYYTLPSSLYFKLGASGTQTIFSERDRAVTDVALLPNGSGILAAIEPPGSSNQVPVPGKLKMLKSKNLKVWEEMEVDYRAVAQRAVLAAVDGRHVWVATDTGMILNLTDSENASR